MPINVRLDVVLAERKMRLNTLSQLVGITVPNLSILKNGKAKAIKISTLEGICDALSCQPGDLLRYEEEEKEVALPYFLGSQANTFCFAMRK